MTSSAQTLPSGHSVEKLSEEENKKIQKFFPVYGDLIRLQPGGWFFEEKAADVITNVQKFKFRPDDVIASSFPKSGTTWSQEILWTFLKNPNLDSEEAFKSIDIRSPHFEADLFLNAKLAPKLGAESEIVKALKSRIKGPVAENAYVLAYCDSLPGARVLKTHLAFSILPSGLMETNKVLYMARDPRDVINSRFSFFQLMKVHNFQGNFDQYVDFFLDEQLYYNPYWSHLKEAWDLREHPNMLFLYYEDLKRNPLKEYMKINKFLNLNLPEEKVQKIVEYTSFGEMKKRSEEGKVDQPMSDGGRLINHDVKSRTGGFYRKGKVGDWTDNFTEEQVSKINAWIKKSTKDFPSNFPYLPKDK